MIAIDFHNDRGTLKLYYILEEAPNRRMAVTTPTTIAPPIQTGAIPTPTAPPPSVDTQSEMSVTTASDSEEEEENLPEG